jgi:phage shock protein E
VLIFKQKHIKAMYPDFKELVKNGATILDVRTPEEYSDGHIEGSINISVDKVAAKFDEISAMKQPIITCCRSGARSGMAASLLMEKGIESYNGGPWNSLNKQI